MEDRRPGLVEATELAEYEAIKGMSAFEEAKVLGFFAKKEAVKGNINGFIVGMALVERTLSTKLDKGYNDELKKEMEDIGFNRENPTDEDRLNMALWRAGKINEFISKKTPLIVRGVI